MPTLLRNLSQLVTCATALPGRVHGAAMADVGILENAWLAWNDRGVITGLGPMTTCPAVEGYSVLDGVGRVALPGLVDCHTHLVYAAPRVADMVLRLNGKTYAEIAAAGGGILNSAERLSEVPDELLLEGALTRASEILATGTVAVEVKSGYGLTLEGELRLLRIARQVAQLIPLTVRTTLLAAHALPRSYQHDRAGYVRLITDRIIPQAAEEQLADYVDVFCDDGFFTPAETLQVLEAGARHGLKGRVHANELARSGGVQAAVQAQALSADHLECVGAEELALLAASTVIPVVLPGTAFFLRLEHAPARQMIAADLPLALASDYNPGTCPSGNLLLTWAIACAQLRLLPAEALVALTRNAAAALELDSTHGALAVGRPAHVLLTEALAQPRFELIPYYFGRNSLARVFVAGREVWRAH